MSLSKEEVSLQTLRPEVAALKETLDKFVLEECIPAEEEFEAHLSSRHGDDRWAIDAIPPCIERLKNRAKQLGLWNLFIPPRLIGHVPSDDLLPSVVLTYREYGILCESMGRSVWLAPTACNCSAPDTGNMEVLLEFGTPEQKQKYLIPLLKGEIRSTFLMTEPQVASSDPTNLEANLMKQVVELPNGKLRVEYVLSGRKWWSSGAQDPRCKLAVVVTKMDYSHPSCSKLSQQDADGSKHGSHTIVLVEMPHADLKIVRPLTVFGYDDAPHGHAEVALNNIRLSEENLVLGEGKGFLISQARLGPGRIHHCMRAIGMAARCYELMLQRAMERETFGYYLWEHGGCQEMIASSASDLEAARLLTLSCAAALDVHGPKKARDKISSIKVAVPDLTLKIVDRAIQVFGGAGVCDDFILARTWATLRTLRIADGPDAVHQRTVARLAIRKAEKAFAPQSRL